jgi:hypothetical protein
LAVILLAWLACALLPTVLTCTDSPNFLRTLAAAPAAAAVAGWGLAALCGRIGRRFGPAPSWILACVLIVASFSLSALDVYRVWPRRPDVRQAFLCHYAELGRWAAAAPDDVAVFIPEAYLNHRTTRFFLVGRGNVYPLRDGSFAGPWETIDATRPRPRKRWIVATVQNRLLAPLQQIAPGALVRDFQAPAGNTWAAAWRLPGAGLEPDQAEGLERLSHDLRF